MSGRRACPKGRAVLCAHVGSKTDAGRQILKECWGACVRVFKLLLNEIQTTHAPQPHYCFNSIAHNTALRQRRVRPFPSSMLHASVTPIAQLVQRIKSNQSRCPCLCHPCP